MPVAWYIVPYARSGYMIPFDPKDPENTPALPIRSIALEVDEPELRGAWDYIEIERHALVKIKADDKTLARLDAREGYFRLPGNEKGDTLANLPGERKDGIRGLLIEVGYSEREVQDAFPNDLGEYTLDHLLKFLTTRRRKARYDKNADDWAFDGAAIPCESSDKLDERVKEATIRDGAVK